MKGKGMVCGLLVLVLVGTSKNGMMRERDRWGRGEGCSGGLGLSLMASRESCWWG